MVATPRSASVGHSARADSKAEEIDMSNMARDLRSLKEYADSHRVFSLSLLNDAADYIERLEEQVEDTHRYFEEQRAFEAKG
jgi:hypothetical protein